MTHIARAPQIAMLRGMVRTPRHQLIASMGIGKSGALLLRASAIEWGEGQWPGLVIVSPLQVALNWQREIPLWLPDKRVSLVVGAAAKREAALREDADIYLLTYDNLPWLDEVLPNWGQLGRMLVCDESTRIKRTRVSFQTSSAGKRWLRFDGGVQTNALAKHAAEFPYWVNATGTPIPNGLLDAWGQAWYIDGGQRLGNSFTAFEQRWFRLPVKGGDFVKPEPLPGAAEEITALMADVTTVVRIEDYATVAQPNIIDRVVQMPEKARRAYKTMESQMFAEIQAKLEAKQITVHSAAAKMAKLLQIACLAGETKVLTDKGVVELKKITTAMKVWDGHNWVKHDGCVYKGIKKTIQVAGVYMTPDHLVKVSTGWVKAKEMRDGKPHKRYKWSKVWTPYCISASPATPITEIKGSPLAMRLRLRDILRSARLHVEDKKPPLRKTLRLRESLNKRNSRNDRFSYIPYMERGKSALRKPGPQRLLPLRGKRHKDVRAMEQKFSFFSGRHGRVLRRKSYVGPHRRTERIQRRELPVGYYATTTKQQKRQCVVRHSSWAFDVKPSGQSLWYASTNSTQKVNKTKITVRRSLVKTSKIKEQKVYDLVNCGSNNRFAVMTNTGEFILVHNCGFMYHRDEEVDPDLNLCEELHTAKIDAVESILAETSEPLVVVYYHRALLEMLKRKFKTRLVELDEEGRAQDAWNAGRVEILAFQYSRGGLGLSLQHGGRNICLLQPTYRADDYEQVIERLGPLRQMQAGYNRVVNVFRVVAEGTIDREVFRKVAEKMQLQDLIVDMLRS